MYNFEYIKNIEMTTRGSYDAGFPQEEEVSIARLNDNSVVIL